METRNIRISDWVNRPNYYVPTKRNKNKGIRVILEGTNYSPEDIMYTTESRKWATDALAIHIIELVKADPTFRAGLCDTTMLILSGKKYITVEVCACDFRGRLNDVTPERPDGNDVWIDIPTFTYKKSELTLIN